MPEVKEPKIFYLRDASGAPVACVASKAAEHGERIHVHYAVSIVNPLDAHVFSKEKAKMIALGRLKTPRRFAGQFPIQPAVKHVIMQKLVEPTWPEHVQKAAEHWLKTHPLRKPGEERG